jgi:hypothetical protein
MVGDAAGHLAVEGLGGGDVDDLAAGLVGIFLGASFGQQALARTRTAEDQFSHGRHFG